MDISFVPELELTYMQRNWIHRHNMSNSVTPPHIYYFSTFHPPLLFIIKVILIIQIKKVVAELFLVKVMVF
jgi:hypothetical protein